MPQPCFPILGIVAAGFPRASEGYEDHPIDLQEVLVARPAATFFFRVTDEGLRDLGIPRGAVLIVDRSLPARPGRLGVVEQDGAFVVRPLLPRDPAIFCGIVTASIIRF